MARSPSAASIAGCTWRQPGRGFQVDLVQGLAAPGAGVGQSFDHLRSAEPLQQAGALAALEQSRGSLQAGLRRLHGLPTGAAPVIRCAAARRCPGRASPRTRQPAPRSRRARARVPCRLRRAAHGGTRPPPHRSPPSWRSAHCRRSSDAGGSARRGGSSSRSDDRRHQQLLPVLLLVRRSGHQHRQDRRGRVITAAAVAVMPLQQRAKRAPADDGRGEVESFVEARNVDAGRAIRGSRRPRQACCRRARSRGNRATRCASGGGGAGRHRLEGDDEVRDSGGERKGVVSSSGPCGRISRCRVPRVHGAISPRRVSCIHSPICRAIKSRWISLLPSPKV